MHELEIDLRALDSPAFLVDLGALERNLALLGEVQRRAGCKILLALKGFAMWRAFPLVGEYLAGITASSPSEARLGREELGKEVHAYAPAYSEADVAELLPLVDHLVFNSVAQWRRFRAKVAAAPQPIECGLRLNPEHSEVATPLYDPCAAGSRLGVTRANLQPGDTEGLAGLHFHTLCELGADALERTLAVVETKFAAELGRVRWVNFGGGHHITRPDYDVDRLVALIQGFRQRHGVEVYLEPGEAIALHTGVLVATVLDVVDNGLPIALLDTSATAHMPDVLEMPYRPVVLGPFRERARVPLVPDQARPRAAGAPGERPFTFRLGGLTCLAGDVIGDWSFDRRLEVGDQLVFLDMAHYTMVKTTTFNGVKLPSIATWDPRRGKQEVIRRFGYADYRSRLS